MEFIPENEAGTRDLFVMRCREWGYSIVKSQIAFPDLIVQKDGLEFRAEVEFKSSSFREHGHPAKECDLVICWEHDARLPMHVLELKTETIHGGAGSPRCCENTAEFQSLALVYQMLKDNIELLEECDQRVPQFVAQFEGDEERTRHAIWEAATASNDWLNKVLRTVAEARGVHRKDGSLRVVNQP